MGIDFHALNFLIYAREKKEFKRTITIGRQGLHISKGNLNKMADGFNADTDNKYCENLLLDKFKATSVESIDNSNYENATFVHDMNKELPAHLVNKYDTVFDGGCLEHIFNIPQALKNCSLMCSKGGQIIHVLPANNFCGHGFWQFCPELFFSLYSEQNGYIDTEIFVANVFDHSKIFRVSKPNNGKRVEIISSTKMYILVRTVLNNENFSHQDVQQSDYIAGWNESKKQSKSTDSNSFFQKIKTSSFIVNAKLIYKNLRRQYKHKLSSRNPNLTLIHLK